MAQPVRIENATAGTIVNVAINIIRSEPRAYFGLGLVAVLWSLIPIYGSANSSRTLAVISAKAYQKLLGIEATTQEIYQRLNRKLWSFWWLTLLGGIYISLLMLVCSIALIFFRFIHKVSFILIGGLFLYLYGRASFAEVPLAVEPQQSVLGSLARSFSLSAGYARKIPMVFSISYLILCNIWLSIPYLFFTTMTAVLGGVFLFFLVTNALLNTVLQVVKAVIYYDLVCLKEGIDLHIT
ncbi:MAG: hypothetical protein ACK421_02255 [Pseudanabaenaceae cyanobacterium]